MIRRVKDYIAKRMKGRLTMAEVNDRVQVIRDMVAMEDESAAHQAEDALYRAVLCAVASGAHWPFMGRALARKAIEADEIDFTRWCG